MSTELADLLAPPARAVVRRIHDSEVLFSTTGSWPLGIAIWSVGVALERERLDATEVRRTLLDPAAIVRAEAGRTTIVRRRQRPRLRVIVVLGIGEPRRLDSIVPGMEWATDAVTEKILELVGFF